MSSPPADAELFADDDSGSGGKPKRRPQAVPDVPGLAGDEYPWLTRMVDRANAIVVKEVRQALKSRGFVVTFMLLIIGAWLVSVFGLLNSQSTIEYSSTGRGFFFWFMCALAVATLLVVPFSAHRGLAEERSGNTFELLQITTLSPKQIVRGKLMTAMTQAFLMYSAITPFIAFSSLLQGFDTPTAAYLLVLCFFASVMLSMVALTLTTLAKGKAAQGGTAVVILMGLGMVMSWGIALIFAVLEFGLPVDETEFWWVNGVGLALAASYFFVLQQIAVSQLTFESDNRSTGIRVAVVAQYVIALLCVIIPCWYYGEIGEEIVAFCVIVSGINWAVYGLFFVTEPDALSARIRRDLPKRKPILTLATPFLPGGARGYLLLMLALVLVWWGGHVGTAFVDGFGGARFFGSGTPFNANRFTSTLMDSVTFNITAWTDLQRLTHGIVCYLLVYLGFACAFARWGQRASFEMRPIVPRIVTLLVVAGGVIIPLVLDFIESYTRSYGRPTFGLIDTLNPFYTLYELTRNSPLRHVVIYLLSAGAVIAVLVNLKAVVESVQDLKYNPSLEHAEEDEVDFVEA